MRVGLGCHRLIGESPPRTVAHPRPPVRPRTFLFLTLFTFFSAFAELSFEEWDGPFFFAALTGSVCGHASLISYFVLYCFFFSILFYSMCGPPLLVPSPSLPPPLFIAFSFIRKMIFFFIFDIVFILIYTLYTLYFYSVHSFLICFFSFSFSFSNETAPSCSLRPIRVYLFPFPFH